TMTTNSQKEIYAYHEAGHAVVAVVLNVRFFQTSIIDRESVHGGTEIKKYDGLNVEEQKNLIIVTLAAGIAAKELEPDMKGADNDELKAYELTKHHFGITNDFQYIEDCREEAERQVLKHKTSITAVAKALL